MVFKLIKRICEDYYQDKEVRRLATDLYYQAVNSILENAYSWKPYRGFNRHEMISSVFKDGLDNNIKVAFAFRESMGKASAFKVQGEDVIVLNSGAYRGEESLVSGASRALRKNKDKFLHSFVHEYQHLYDEIYKHNDVEKVSSSYVPYQQDLDKYKEQGVEHIAFYQDIVSTFEASLKDESLEYQLEVFSSSGDAFIETVEDNVEAESGDNFLRYSSDGQRKKLVKRLLDYKEKKRLELEHKLKYVSTVHERKQVGNLYHFTEESSLDEILESNILRASIAKGMGGLENPSHGYVSLTRNGNFDEDSVFNDLALVLDGDKLSDKYKIEPFNWFYVRLKRTSDREQEERIKGDITNLDKYVKSIYINSNSVPLEDILRWSGKHPITFSRRALRIEDKFNRANMSKDDNMSNLLDINKFMKHGGFEDNI